MGDVFEFMDAVKLKYPENFEALITSKKWKERLDVIEELLDTCQKSPKLDPTADYTDLIKHLKFIIQKDANINVQAAAVKLVNALAYGLRSKFAHHASQFLPLMFERFKEKKALLRDALAECCDFLGEIVNLETTSDDIVAAMGKPNPNIKQQVDQFLFRQLARFSPAEQPRKLIKVIVPVLLKHAEDPDKDVRDCSLLALGGVLRLTSDAIFQQLAGDLTNDANKMAKVKEGKENSEKQFAEYQAAKQAASGALPQPQANVGTGNTTAGESIAKEAEPDPWEFMDPVDVLALLPKDFYSCVASPKWSERKDALDNLLKLVTDNPKLDPKAQYGEIMDTLFKLLLKDSNINVCAVAAKIIAGMAKGLRTKFGPFAVKFATIIFDKFKEKKAILRDPLIEAIDAVYSTTDLNSLCDAIVAAFGKPNPDIKTQINRFLYRAIKDFNVKTVPIKTIKTLMPLIVKCTGESVADCREAAFSAIGAIMKAVGKQNATVMLGDVANDKIKMTQIEKFYNQAVEESKDEIPCEINQVVSKPVIVPAVLPTKTPNITISNPVVSKSIRISTEPKKPPPPPVLKCSSSAPLATKQTPRSANIGRVVINTSRTVNVKPLEVPRTLPERPKTVAPNIRPSRPLNGPGLSASKRPATTNDLSRLQPTSTTSRLQPTSVQNNIHGSKLVSLADSKLANSRPMTAASLSGSRLPLLVRKS